MKKCTELSGEAGERWGLGGRERGFAAHASGANVFSTLY